MEWRPIGTAPKDGTQIILAGSQPEPFVKSGGFDSLVKDWMDSRGWGYEWDVYGYGQLEPTHWMPLPNPPND